MLPFRKCDALDTKLADLRAGVKKMLKETNQVLDAIIIRIFI